MKNGMGQVILWGLKGEEINLYARITAVADVYDALTSKRPRILGYLKKQ